MADPTLNNLEAKAGAVASSVVAHNAGWLTTNRWSIVIAVCTFVAGMVVRGWFR